MIVTEIYDGQGLGNQLWCYVTTRVIAKDKGYAFGIKSPEKFKCTDFLDLDYGKPVIGGDGPEGGPPRSLPKGIRYYYCEKKIVHPENGVDIRMYDQNLVTIPDHTKIDGIMQDEQYILHRKEEIRKWLKVKKEFECSDYASDDICVINFRGGEYVHVPKIFLTQKYWGDAVSHMRKINNNIRFVVITDDVKTAKKFFPSFEVHHFSIAKDYVVIKNAHYLILSNSSFACFPAWLNENLKLCIAPKYWSQHNTSDGFWGCSYNIIQGWQYLDREGRLQSYDTCMQELIAYIKNHEAYFNQIPLKHSFLVVSSYNNDLHWIPEYTAHYHIYDKGEVAIYPPTLDARNIERVPNVGYNLSDYFTFIIDNYEKLPVSVLFTKGNVVPRHVSKSFFDRIMNNAYFTPIEDWHEHKERWPVSFFASDGGFCEINNSWYLNHIQTKYFHNYNDFLRFCFKDPVIPRYVRFAPGGNYIVPRENILKYPKVFYQNLRAFISYTQLPGEAHIMERSLHTLWTANFIVNEVMLTPIDITTFVAPAKTNLSKQAKIRAYLARVTPEKAKRQLDRLIALPQRFSKNTEIPGTEVEFFKALKSRLKVVFDVGAREDLTYYHLKSDCAYHLFEPNQRSIKLLKKQISRLDNPKITLNEYGLSDKKEDNCVYYENSQSFVINPVLKDNIDNGQRYSLRRLDDYVAEHKINHIDYLKIDAEGLDYRIILGGLTTITHAVSYIQFEYWDGVQKFVTLLGKDFDFYLMMEPALLKGITTAAMPQMSASQRKKDYRYSMVKLDSDVMSLIDTILVPLEYGGNIFGISKNIKNAKIEELIFPL